MLNIGSLIADEVEHAAEWRWRKAAEFPKDADRNLEATETLERIAAELRQCHGSAWHWRLQGICNKNSETYSAILSQLIRAVGFGSSAYNAAEFLDELCLLLEPVESELTGQIHPLAR